MKPAQQYIGSLKKNEKKKDALKRNRKVVFQFACLEEG